MNLTSMVLRTLLDRGLSPLHLEVKPSRAQVVLPLLAAGAVGAMIGAAAMALLAPATGSEARAALRRGLARVAPQPLATRLAPGNHGGAQKPSTASAPAGA